jgi:hypothetical protein
MGIKDLYCLLRYCDFYCRNDRFRLVCWECCYVFLLLMLDDSFSCSILEPVPSDVRRKIKK